MFLLLFLVEKTVFLNLLQMLLNHIGALFDNINACKDFLELLFIVRFEPYHLRLGI